MPAQKQKITLCLFQSALETSGLFVHIILEEAPIFPLTSDQTTEAEHSGHM